MLAEVLSVSRETWINEPPGVIWSNFSIFFELIIKLKTIRTILRTLPATDCIVSATLGQVLLEYMMSPVGYYKCISPVLSYTMEFFLNRTKFQLNQANLGKLINHWSMNWAQFKDPVSHMCLAGAVITCWPLTTDLESRPPAKEDDSLNLCLLHKRWLGGRASNPFSEWHFLSLNNVMSDLFVRNEKIHVIICERIIAHVR